MEWDGALNGAWDGAYRGLDGAYRGLSGLGMGLIGAWMGLIGAYRGLGWEFYWGFFI